MAVYVNSRIEMDEIKSILARRGIEPGGKAQRYLTTQLIGAFDAYVPMRSGALKATAVRNNAPPYDVIVYDGPYARRLYFNPQFNFNEAPQRGAYWDKRAWADQKDIILKNFENAVNAGRFD